MKSETLIGPKGERIECWVPRPNVGFAKSHWTWDAALAKSQADEEKMNAWHAMSLQEKIAALRQ